MTGASWGLRELKRTVTRREEDNWTKGWSGCKDRKQNEVDIKSIIYRAEVWWNLWEHWHIEKERWIGCEKITRKQTGVNTKSRETSKRNGKEENKHKENKLWKVEYHELWTADKYKRGWIVKTVETITWEIMTRKKAVKICIKRRSTQRRERRKNDYGNNREKYKEDEKKNKVKTNRSTRKWKRENTKKLK